MMILSVTGSLLVVSITLVTQCITSAAHVIQQRPHPMLHGSFSSWMSYPQFSLSSLPAVNVDHEDAFYKASKRERETLAYMRNRRQASCVRQCHRYRWIQSEPQFLVEVPLPRMVPMDCLSVAISSDTIAISIPDDPAFGLVGGELNGPCNPARSKFQVLRSASAARRLEVDGGGVERAPTPALDDYHLEIILAKDVVPGTTEQWMCLIKGEQESPTIRFRGYSTWYTWEQSETHVEMMFLVPHSATVENTKVNIGTESVEVMCEVYPSLGKFARCTKGVVLPTESTWMMQTGSRDGEKQLIISLAKRQQGQRHTSGAVWWSVKNHGDNHEMPIEDMMNTYCLDTFSMLLDRSLFLMTNSGEVLIEKHWRGVTTRAVCDFFWDEINHRIGLENKSDMPPILQCPSGGGGDLTSDRSCVLVHVQQEGLFVIAVVKFEVPPLLTLEFLHRVCAILREYLGKVDETAIKDNFSLVYQLLEEMVDYGFPLTTEPNALRAMIKPPTIMGRMVAAATGKSSVSDVLPDGTISSMPWRKAGVKYSQNEIYFDIVEEVDVLISSNGQVITSDVSGSIQSVCHLSGLPDLLLILANPEVIDDCSFHPCVRYSRFEKDRVISFVPPDGEFELMRYRVTNSMGSTIIPPIYCTPTISFESKGLEKQDTGHVYVVVGIRPQNSLHIPSKRGATVLTTEDVVVLVPFPRAVRTANLTATTGTVLYDEGTRVAKWKLGRLNQRSMPQLTGNLILQPGEVPQECPPIQIHWKAPNTSVSGLMVSALQLTNERYKPYKGVRALTKSGRFHVRTHS